MNYYLGGNLAAHITGDFWLIEAAMAIFDQQISIVNLIELYQTALNLRQKRKDRTRTIS